MGVLPLSVESINRDGKPCARTVEHGPAMRRYRRKPVIWAAKLAASSGVVDCIILDLSSGGAKLKVSSIMPLNEAAVLVFGKFGTFPCRIVRSSAGEVGIEFTDPPKAIADRLSEILPLGDG